MTFIGVDSPSEIYLDDNYEDVLTTLYLRVHFGGGIGTYVSCFPRGETVNCSSKFLQ